MDCVGEAGIMCVLMCVFVFVFLCVCVCVCAYVSVCIRVYQVPAILCVYE
jgi:hypothetical protein